MSEKTIDTIKQKMRKCRYKREMISHFLIGINITMKKIDRYTTMGGEVGYVLLDNLEDDEIELLITYVNEIKGYARHVGGDLDELKELNDQIEDLCEGLSEKELMEVGKTNWKKNDYKSDDKITYYEHEKS